MTGDDVSGSATGTGAEEAPFEAMGRLMRAAGDAAGGDPVRASAARARFLHRARRNRWSVVRRPWIWALGLAATGTAAFLLLRSEPPLGYEIAKSPWAAAPGSPVLPGGTLVRFSEGTEIRLAPDARGRVAEIGAAGARLVLESGGMQVNVAHRFGARWVVEAGPFRVRVSGTQFQVSWRRLDEQLEISMQTGSVVVEGPNFVQRLEAGQRLVASTDAGIVHLGREEPAVIEPLAPIPSAMPPPRAPASAPRPAARSRGPAAAGRPAASLPEPGGASRPTSWSRRLTDGEFESVIAEARRDGLDEVLRRRGLDDLGALATAARLTQRFDLARQALEAERGRFPDTAAAREAAFHLGRLAEDASRDMTAAIRWYDRYLAESPAGGLAAEALGRKMVALARLPGRRPEAVAAARLYLERHPDAPYAALARSLLEADRQERR